MKYKKLYYIPRFLNDSEKYEGLIYRNVFSLLSPDPSIPCSISYYSNISRPLRNRKRCVLNVWKKVFRHDGHDWSGIVE